MQFQPANLIFDKKLKGHLPVTRLAVSESGALMVAVPDQHQSRLYHLVRITMAGECDELIAFSVETLSNIDFSESGRAFVATTDDDVYVFCGDEKSRFFPDRRDVYTDISISSSGELFVVGSADMLVSGYSVTLARTAGEVVWTKDLPFSLTAARISPDGSLIVVGSEEGTVVMLDGGRSVIWQFDGGDAISALALSNSPDFAVIGTKGGAVTAITSGQKLWEVVGEGPVEDCALSGDGTMIAVARMGDVGKGRVECLTNDGTVILEHRARAGIASVACSEDGRFVAISCKDGTVQVLEIVPVSARFRAAEEAKKLYEEACGLADHGQHTDAVAKLRRALELSPHHVDACLKLVEVARAFVEESVRKADDLGTRNEFADAARELDAVQQTSAHAPELFGKVTAARERLAERVVSYAADVSEAKQIEEALAAIEALLQLDVANIRAREELMRLENALAARCLAGAEQALTAGRPSEGVQLLEKAYDLTRSEEVSSRLVDARCKHALAEGLALYDAKKYSQAAFQFRKVLSIDPENGEARKYIEYCESLRQDDSLSDRFSKLE